MVSKLVAFIIGAGPNVGQSVGRTLAQNGYQVAAGSRSAKPNEDGFLPVALDVAKPESIERAFQTVTKELGPPNVVIFNAALFSPADPQSPSLDNYLQSSNLNTGFFVAVQNALVAFRSDVNKASPKAFIVTGNILPFVPASNFQYLGLGLQKHVQSYLTELFYNQYGKEGFRFHYAHFVSKTGGSPPYSEFVKSGPIHAEVYWRLITSEKPETWDYRFISDGSKYEA